MALNDKGEESLMRIKEPQKREKCPLEVTQLQKLNSLSFSAARVSVLPWGVLPPSGPRHPPVSHLPSPLNPPAFAEHPWAPGDNGHVTLDLVSVVSDQQGSQSTLSHPILYCLCVPSRSHVCLFAPPLDCRPPGSSVHEILQARILPFPPPGDLSQPRDWTRVPCDSWTARQTLHHWDTGNTLSLVQDYPLCPLVWVFPTHTPAY